MIDSSRALEEELAALSGECARLGTDLLDAGRAMADPGAPPAQALIDRIAAVRGAFVALRTRLIERAVSLEVPLHTEPERIVSLSDLETSVSALAETEAARARTTSAGVEAGPARGRGPAPVEAETAPRRHAGVTLQQAIAVLDQVLGLVHQDDPSFQPLQDCQARARELRAAITHSASSDPDGVDELIDDALPAFVCLLGLVTSRESLDDERWAELEGVVAHGLGRPLALAATRGRLAVAGAERPARRPAPATSPPAGSSIQTPSPPPAARARELLRTSVVGPMSPLPSTELDPRLAAVGWWAVVYRAWVDWRMSETGFAHAVRAELARHPHLLSVPLRQSTEAGQGVASGHFFLLEHVDKRGPGFRRAIDGVGAEAAAGASRDTLDRRLWDILVTEGRLQETYPDLLSEIVVTVVPNQSVWADGGLTESSDATVVMTREGGRPGEAPERLDRLTEPRQRQAAHHFAVDVPPFTARFFYIKGGELKEGRDVHVHLTENGAPSDRALLLVMRTSSVLRPRRHSSEGTSLPGFGREYTGLWIVVFNPEPDRTGHFELALTLRQPPPPRSASFRR